MNEKPLVSILIPAFNSQNYIEVAISSALSQSYKNLEIICIDDGSTDETWGLLLSLSSRDHRIKVFQNKLNLGVVKTRNELLRKASGEFITWLDADDWISDNKIETQLEFMQKNISVGAVGTGVSFVNSEGLQYNTEIYSSNWKKQRIDPEICCASVMVRRAAVESAGLFREFYKVGGEDGDWLLRISDRWRITNIPNILYSYRKNPNSLSASNISEIRRLGVIARYSARIRRNGICPIDSKKIGKSTDLDDESFLRNSELTYDEKIIATTFPRRRSKPLISVVIPYFNMQNYIFSCLNSLESSSYKNFEVLIYDDGSEIKLNQILTKEIISTFSFEIKIISGEKNNGVGFARNELIKMVSSKFICFLDADDQVSYDRFVIQLKYLLENNEVIGVGSGIRYINRDGKIIYNKKFPKRAVSKAGFEGCCGTFMLRWDDIRDIRYKEKYRGASEDVDYLLEVSKKGELHNIRKILYYYRMHDQSLTHQRDWQTQHTEYMFNRFMRQRNSGRVSSLISNIAYLDGTQTGDLLLVSSWRDIRENNRGMIPCAKLFLMLPKSFIRCVFNFAKSKLTIIGYPILRYFYDFLKKTKHSIKKFLTINNLINSINYISHFRSKSKKITVLVHDNWGDLESALDLLLPARAKSWGNVKFVCKKLFLSTPDYHLVLNTPSHEVNIKFNINRKIVFAIGEPPTEVHKPLHQGIEGENSVVFTCDKNLGGIDREIAKYKLSPCMTRTWSVKRSYEELMSNDEIVKTKKMSWITSNLVLLDGHKERMNFLNRIRGKVDFDLFGRGFQEIEDKWYGLAPYEYSIAFENTISDYYFTEKLMDCFVAHTVPIYYGSPSIKKFFPEKSIIVLDPYDPNIINKLKDIVNFDDYNARIESIKESKKLVCNEYNMFIRLANYFQKDYLTTSELSKKYNKTKIKPIKLDWRISR